MNYFNKRHFAKRLLVLFFRVNRFISDASNNTSDFQKNV